MTKLWGRGRRGFTLLELVVVIAVVAVLAAVGLVGFNQFIGRTQQARAVADMSAVSTAVLARAQLDNGGVLSRDLVLQVMEDAGATVTDGLSAASSWVVNGSDQAPAAPGQWSVGFDHDDEVVSNTDGTRAALVAMGQDGRTYAVTVSAAGSSPVASLPQTYVPGTTATSVLTQTATVLAAGPVESPTPTPTPTPTATPLTVSYATTTFSRAQSDQQLAATVTGASGSVTYSLSGTLPSGVSFDPATGTLTGPHTWGLGLTQVAAGLNFHVGLGSDGQVYAWGYNGYGQLGDGTTTSRSTPAAVHTAGTPMAGKTITRLAVGAYHVLALASDGTVYAWGWNKYGQLGDGTTVDRYTPVAVQTAATPMAGKVVTQVAGGSVSALALASDGTLYAWGHNLNGLGDGTTSDRSAPVAVVGLSGKQIIQAATWSSFSIAVDSAGAVYTWGANGSGELGDGTTTARLTAAVLDPSNSAMAGKKITQVAAESTTALALASDGTVFAWGANGVLQIGDGTQVDRWRPVAVAPAGTAMAGKQVVSLAARGNQALALSSEGTLYSWGYNLHGELGSGSTATPSVPVPVMVAGTALAGKPVAQFSMGVYSALVVSTDGTVVAWGSNAYGQLADGTTTTQWAPVASAPTLFTGQTGFPFTVTITVKSGSVTATTGPLTFS